MAFRGVTSVTAVVSAAVIGVLFQFFGKTTNVQNSVKTQKGEC